MPETARQWLMWARPDAAEGQEFGSFTADGDSTYERRLRSAEHVPVRVFEDPAGPYMTLLLPDDHHPDYISPYRPTDPEDGVEILRLRAELLTGDPYDTSNCPIAARCELCLNNAGTGVAMLESRIGLACITTCSTCTGDRPLPDMLGFMDRIAEHCGHVGLNLDEIAALTEAED